MRIACGREAELAQRGCRARSASPAREVAIASGLAYRGPPRRHSGHALPRPAPAGTAVDQGGRTRYCWALMHRRRPSVAALAVVALAACARAGDSPSARDSSFVATMIELRALPSAPPEPPGRDRAARQAVLRRRGTTPAELEALARELARDPTRATAVWRKIDQGAAAASVAVPPSFPSPDSAGKP